MKGKFLFGLFVCVLFACGSEDGDQTVWNGSDYAGMSVDYVTPLGIEIINDSGIEVDYDKTDCIFEEVEELLGYTGTPVNLIVHIAKHREDPDGTRWFPCPPNILGYTKCNGAFFHGTRDGVMPYVIKIVLPDSANPLCHSALVFEMNRYFMHYWFHPYWDCEWDWCLEDYITAMAIDCYQQISSGLLLHGLGGMQASR